jgi:uncharacterized UPF0160 family protein
MDVLIDVGGEYDPANCRYDHHQRGFEEVFGNGFVTKLSSAGLVYKHYGMEIISGASPNCQTSSIHLLLSSVLFNAKTMAAIQA